MRTLSVILAVLCLLSPRSALASTAETPTTVADREGLNLTVYNGGTALIHDRRRVQLDEGFNRIAWRDVSANMDPTSALLESLGSNRVAVLEQNFDYDVLDPQALLAKYLGREVTVVHPATFRGENDLREKARVLSVTNGIVLQYRDRIETDVRGYIVFPDVPPDFRDRPTLALDLHSDRGGAQPLDLSYLTSGLSWHADYVGVVDANDAKLSLTGLVTVSNTSGASYDDARLQLVAGNVNVAQPVGEALRTIARAASTPAEYSANGVQQENYFEYHLYTMPRRTTLLDKQTKQLTLLTARDVPMKKTLELRGSPDYYRSADADIGDRLPVGVYLSFENRGGDLGVPLPAGIVRLYKNDSRGLGQFLGSDTIDHTPKNETVRLHLGDSFDVTARKRQTNFRVAGDCATDSAYSIVLSNAKAVAGDVLVVEPIPGDWQILAESAPHTKSSASTATWLIRVPPNGRATLTYAARTKWC